MKTICRHTPIMKTLVCYLSVVDYINLRRATVNAIPSSFVSSSELAFQRLVCRLKEFTALNPALVEELIRLLCECDDFYLSGGFLVALLRNDPFDIRTQDLDFFVAESSYQGSPLIKDAEPGGFGLFPDDEVSYARVMPFLRVFTLQNSPVQMIVHECKEKVLESISTFDLPICRNYLSRQAGLRFSRLEDLTCARTLVDTAQLLSRIYGLPHRTNLQPIYEKNASRIIKYRQRGIDVQIRVADAKTLTGLIQPSGRLPSYEMTYRLMGKHTPPLCFVCPCAQSRYNPRCYYLYLRCKCVHHVAFNAEATETYDTWRRDLIIKEHIEFWSKKK